MGLLGTLLLLRCHQMGLTSGCYTVLATVPMLQIRSQLSCRLRQGEKQVSRPPCQAQHRRLASLAPAAKCAQGHRGFQTPKGQFITQVWRSLYTASQQQNRRWSLPVSLENPWPQPAVTLKWLKSISSTASLSQGLEKPVWMGYSSLQTREKSSSLEPRGGGVSSQLFPV